MSSEEPEVDTGSGPTSPEVPVTSPPNKNDKPEMKPEVPSGDHEDVNWWSGWGNTQKWAKTLTDVSCNVTASVSYGLELANQVLDKEIEIEIDVDKVTEQVSTLATKTVSQSQKIIEKSSAMVGAGVNLVSEDVQELSQALVEDTTAGYSAITNATYSTIEKMGGEGTANTAVKVKDTIFGGINAFASAILADSTDSDSDSEKKSRKILKGPEARLNQLRISPATYCNEPEEMDKFLRWLIDFDLESQKIKAEISDLLVETPQVRSLYSKLVPEAVTHSDFWQRYYYRLNIFNEAEMRRSRLVERANTEDEDEQLDSWSSDETDDEPEVTNQPTQGQPDVQDKTGSESKREVEDIGPDGNDEKIEKVEPEVELKIEPKIEPKVEPKIEAEPEAETKSNQSETRSEGTNQTPESEKWTKLENDESSVQSRDESLTNEQSDDWEQEFDIDEIKEEEKALPVEKKETGSRNESDTETGEDWDDWS